MSKFVEVKTEFKSKEDLLAAIEANNLTPKVSEENDLDLDAYYSHERRSKCCSIVVPKSQLGCVSNDIGFMRQSDGSYTAVVGDMDTKRFHNIKKSYAVSLVEKSMNNLKVKGFTFQRTEEKNGEVLYIGRRF